MKICIVGPAHPFRGGLASIMETMARTFMRQGHDVRIETFTVQYPRLLFPGQSQTVITPAPADLTIRRSVHSMWPINWLRIGRRIARQRPDMVLMKYWTPYMAPCFGTIARLAGRNGHTRTICQIDNVEPHERHFFDHPLNRYFLRSADGFVYMSEQVHRELRAYTDAPALFSPHPLFEQFGMPVPRERACKALGVDPEQRYALFFGLIRDYKGLDLLLDAWALLRRREALAGRRLIVAGEFYASRDKYLEQIRRSGLFGEVILHDRFIPDDQVGNYFSAADLLVLPYRSATQSGVTQIAYQFDLPMIVTDVGGLPEIVPDGRAGFVVRPDAVSIADAIERIWQPELLAHFRTSIRSEKGRFSWEEMCRRIEEVYRMTNRTPASSRLHGGN